MKFVPDINTRKILLRMLGIALAAGGVVLFYIIYRYIGALDAIIYSFVFLSGAAGIPVVIYMFGPNFPLSMGKLLGKLNWILGSLTNNGTALVQTTDDKWSLAPMRYRDGYWEFWHDDEWWTIHEGEDVISVLGLRPFALVPMKDDKNTLLDERVDTRNPRSSGAEISKRERAGYKEKDFSYHEEKNDEWILDIVKSRLPITAGRIGILDKTERQELKRQAAMTNNIGYQTVLGALGALVFGGVLGLLVTSV